MHILSFCLTSLYISTYRKLSWTAKRLPMEIYDDCYNKIFYRSAACTYHLTTLGHFTFRISLSLRPKTETKQLNFGLTPVLSLTNHCSPSSLT